MSGLVAPSCRPASVLAFTAAVLSDRQVNLRQHFQFSSVFRISISLNADPDPGFHLIADPDSGF